jgi:hypothetical protein
MMHPENADSVFVAFVQGLAWGLVVVAAGWSIVSYSSIWIGAIVLAALGYTAEILLVWRSER